MNRLEVGRSGRELWDFRKEMKKTQNVVITVELESKIVGSTMNQFIGPVD